MVKSFSLVLCLDISKYDNHKHSEVFVFQDHFHSFFSERNNLSLYDIKILFIIFRQKLNGPVRFVSSDQPLFLLTEQIPLHVKLNIRIDSETNKL